jgi:uncharacterized membrane protein YfcA
MSFITILFLLLIGLLAGMLSGVVGVGGAIVIIPLLLLLGFSQQEAQGTSIAGDAATNRNISSYKLL